MNRTKSIETLHDLEVEISVLEKQCVEKEAQIKHHVDEMRDSLRPSTLLKKAIPATLSFVNPLKGKSITGNLLSMLSGSLINRFSRRKKRDLPQK